jgi:hypothetical protein
MRRLFTFGCSFTSYHWPTWADIIGKEFDYFENWGMSGASNQFIFNSLVESKIRNNFTENDTIAIMLTNVSRLDIYRNKVWHLPGNIYTTQVYSDEFVKNFTDHRGFLIRDLATISAIIELLKKWNVKYYILSMVPINNENQNNQLNSMEALKHADVLKLYKDAILEIRPSVYEKVFNFSWDVVRDEPKLMYEWKDTHPRPIEHLRYLDLVLPEIKISDSTREWVKNYVYWNSKAFLNYPKIRL